MDTAQLKKVYKETIAPALQKQFNYSSAMEIPVLKKIVINQGLGDATQDKKIVDVAINEITAITGQQSFYPLHFHTLCHNRYRQQILTAQEQHALFDP